MKKLNQIGIKLQLGIVVVMAIIASAATFAITFHGIEIMASFHKESAEWANRKAAVHLTSSLGSRIYQVIAGAATGRDLASVEADWADIKHSAEDELTNITSETISDTDTKKVVSGLAKKEYQELVAIFENELLPALKEGRADKEFIRSEIDKVDTSAGGIEMQMFKLVDFVDRDALAAEQNFEAVQKETVRRFVIVDLVAILLLAAVMGLVGKNLLRQLGAEPARAVEIARRISQGDLSNEIAARQGDNSSLMFAIKEMQGGLRELIGDTRNVSRLVNTAASELALDAAQVTESSAQQIDYTSSMAAVVEQLTVSINHISSTTSEAKNSVSNSSALAEQGEIVVDKAVEAIEKIAMSVLQSSSIIHDLGDQSKRISAVSNAIKDIADQTNLLALNAAIEAARAGEQGRGFAVVADEVRKLAEGTMKFTQEITKMVSAIETGVANAITGMEQCKSQVGTGVQFAKEVGSAMGEIKGGIAVVVTAFTETAQALIEQSEAGKEMAKSVQNVAIAAEQNGARVRNMAGAAHQLETLAARLDTTATKFKL